MAKERVTHTIDKTVADNFNKISKENAINKSALVEKLIKNWIKEQEYEKVDSERS